MGKYKERMEILNSTLDSWPSERLQRFIQQLEEKMSQSDEIGYIEYLQNLNMVAMGIVASFLDAKPEQSEILRVSSFNS